MTAPLSPERLAEIESCASPHLAAMLAEERPDSAVMHRIELLAEVKRLTEQVAELQAQLDQTRTILPAEFFDALTADDEPQPVPELVALFRRDRVTPEPPAIEFDDHLRSATMHCRCGRATTAAIGMAELEHAMRAAIGRSALPNRPRSL